MHTPSSYMYSDLRSFGGITNKEAASELLTGRTRAATVRPVIELMKEPFIKADRPRNPKPGTS